HCPRDHHDVHSCPTRRSSDLRFDFGAAMADGLDAATGAATLTAFTAAAVGKGLDLLPSRPERLIVCGGGRHNPLIMEMLVERAQDRKSTRLNSSHVKISYAVF